MTNALERSRWVPPQAARPPCLHGSSERRHYGPCRRPSCGFAAGNFQGDSRSRTHPWRTIVRSQPAWRRIDRSRSIAAQLPGIAVFDELWQSVARLEALTDPTAGEVRIGATEPLATGLLSAGLNRMAIRYPRMKFHVVQADRNVLRTRDLPARRVDFAIAHILEPIGGDEFAVEELFKDSWVVLVGRTSKWARRPNVRLADLVSERWILPPPGEVLAPLHQAFDVARLKRPRADVMTTSVHIHINLLATGNFVTAMPRSTFGWGMDRLPFKVSHSICRQPLVQLELSHSRAER